MIVRDERPGDAAGIATVITQAFALAEHASGAEAAIVDALRAAGALSVSLAADDAGEIVGHVAFSPVTIENLAQGWFGLGPVAVRPDRQGYGIGRALIEAGLERLRALDSRGCVVLGDPEYYRRFGFVSDAGLRYPGAPAEYFLRLCLAGPVPAGTVGYHAAFNA